MKVLLDTCTFLWISAGAAQLSAAARQTFADPANDVLTPDPLVAQYPVLTHW